MQTQTSTFSRGDTSEIVKSYEIASFRCLSNCVKASMNEVKIVADLDPLYVFRTTVCNVQYQSVRAAISATWDVWFHCRSHFTLT